EGWFYSGSREGRWATNRRLLEPRAGVPVRATRYAILIPPDYIEPSAMETQSIIGTYDSVAAGAVVSRSVVRGSIINQGALVENILLSDSIIGERAVVTGNYTRLNVGDSSEMRIA